MSNSTPDYRENFFKFKPVHAFLTFVLITVVLVCISILAFGCYLLVCFLDRNPPIDDMHYSASDAKIGEATTVSMNFYRTRICEYSFIKMITDSKGKIVFQSQGNRLVNGPIRRIETTEEYKIAPNAAPGRAVMHLYAYWKCPGNIIHRYAPIHKEYTDTLELSLKEGAKDLSDMTAEDAEAEILKDSMHATSKQ